MSNKYLYEVHYLDSREGRSKRTEVEAVNKAVEVKTTPRPEDFAMDLIAWVQKTYNMDLETYKNSPERTRDIKASLYQADLDAKPA